jgi:hypothetical protein
MNGWVSNNRKRLIDEKGNKIPLLAQEIQKDVSGTTPSFGNT